MKRLYCLQDHATKLCEAAELVCRMSPDPEGVGMLRYSATLLRQLTPQLANAAVLVSLRPNRTADDPAVKNLLEFRNLWKERADALRLGVDVLVSMDDMLAVTEQHIIEDCNNGVNVSGFVYWQTKVVCFLLIFWRK